VWVVQRRDRFGFTLHPASAIRVARHCRSKNLDGRQPIEARRQSLLASAEDADRETLTFLEHAGDPRGWK